MFIFTILHRTPSQYRKVRSSAHLGGNPAYREYPVRIAMQGHGHALAWPSRCWSSLGRTPRLSRRVEICEPWCPKAFDEETGTASLCRE